MNLRSIGSVNQTSTKHDLVIITPPVAVVRFIDRKELIENEFGQWGRHGPAARSKIREYEPN